MENSVGAKALKRFSPGLWKATTFCQAAAERCFHPPALVELRGIEPLTSAVRLRSKVQGVTVFRHFLQLMGENAAGT